MAPIEAPSSGIRVRMYRQGHGDCFLLTMRNAAGGPFHVLIDCGFKPGSEIHEPVENVVRDIAEATGGRLDVLMVTHEHQDHVNLFTAALDGRRLFDDIEVDTLWLGWTADPDDEAADEIRKGHQKAVRLLLQARTRLAGRLGLDISRRVDQMLALEGFSAAETPRISTAKVAQSVAEAMRYVTGKVPDRKKRKYFKPHETMDLDAPGIRVVALGPPRSRPDLNKDEPTAAAELGRVYEKGHGLDFGFGFGLGGLLSAVDDENGEEAGDAYRPFSEGLVRSGKAWKQDRVSAGFLDQFYPDSGDTWRHTDDAWQFALDWFARKINVEVNNSSLVLAFEMVSTGKVLLFAGDAQYGNWLSWDDSPIRFADGGATTARDLLARTVLYKVGHHGSHNATLKDDGSGDYPSLGWMAAGDHRDEFVAMIPANEPWALAVEPKPWVHPLPTIRKALDEMAGGRVFQSDIDFKAMKKPRSTTRQHWRQFQQRAKGSRDQSLYFDYWIPDE